MLSLGSFAFLNPWVLTGLIALPILWFLLRVFPPVPRMIHLPGAWLLEGLIPDRQTTSKTPWWLLLLRTILAALILIALAHPVINPAESLNIKGALRLVIDNNWAAAQTWTPQLQAAGQTLDRAGRSHTEIYILTTTPEGGRSEPTQQGPMTAAQAQTVLNALKPQPWPSDYAAAAKIATATRNSKPIHSIWISTGLDGKQSAALVSALQRQGGLTYMEPEPAQRALILLPRARIGQELSAAIAAAPSFPEKMPVSIDALSADGRVLDRQQVLLQSGDMPAEIKFTLPDALRGQVGQFRITGRNGAGAVALMDNVTNRKSVGIVSARDESKSAPLIESGYYITRALEPYADLYNGDIDELLKRKGLSVIILPDIGALPAETLEALEKWVRGGGLLLRMAGPNMSKADNFLTPTPLRKGERALNGALTWDKPQKLAPMPKTSPLYGLDIPPDIEVRQQVLPDSAADMEKKTWAALQDGTPLVTAAPLDKGLIVLIHTTATPQWSNLALSGLYVQMLQRIVGLAGVQNAATAVDGTLHPQKTIDGFGALIPPPSTAQPIDAKNFDAQMPDPAHPPGLYGHTGFNRTLNIGDRIKNLTLMPSLPAGVERTGFTHGHETDLMPWLLAAALVLFLFDWAIMLLIQGLGSARLRLALRTGLILCCLLPAPARAQDEPAGDIKRAGAIHLAYIQSAEPSLNTVTQHGLENLAKVLSERTSVEPADVVALDPERDDLSFYPLLYWPIAGNENALSGAAAQKVQFYLDHGGTILFDTREQDSDGRNAAALRTLTASLDIPPLVQAPRTHVLTKSFYLLQNFTGRVDNNRLWIEEQSASGRDGVSSVLIGGNDWAAAWAGVAAPEGSSQQEASFRFGVNLVMYALTGNYKADQVHVPYILERLGQ